MKKRSESKSPAQIRCAIYTRPPLEQRGGPVVGQEFNSLDAQRESGEFSVSSQRSEGWVCCGGLPDRSDAPPHGGHAGGTMERPGLKRLMADIEIDVKVPGMQKRATFGVGASVSFGHTCKADRCRCHRLGILCSSIERTQTMPNDGQDVNWDAVIARCLAYLCLKDSEYRDKDKLEQAQFLAKLGLPLDDQAGVTGSTPGSLRELARQAKNKKGGKKNGKGKAK